MKSYDNSNLDDVRPKMPRSIPMPEVKPQIKINNESVIILRSASMISSETIKELEEKYSGKFGCKVVIVESNLQYVDIIDG